ncbi:Gfo/Idh/MocA family oxidoreductase [Desulfosporosinus fructosivorans]|uniref:Gfo/Idh/MocA family oxidoreductase n=1 Tax=Desulfosporosinus fructosivorans TaxID=2018669 RepID=A0A4Z0QXZ8_9FIRM|nr:Gfo/Idh/MocA family oxidoreductase [Desulfosporosinus fructosivorans]TGE35388.1 Gfo/Idh/MocA family oxidoreductase [Desulfosporosinus fructosivorans]
MKVLMVGLGGIGQRHMRNLKSILGSKVSFSAYRVQGLNLTVTDQMTVNEGINLEQEFNITVYSDLDQALDEKPDIVFVTNPTSEHMKVALAAAKVGCDLFIEKPLSHSYENVTELIQTVADRKIVCYVGFQNRFHPCLQLLHQLLSEKAVGRILAVNAEVGEFLPGWHPYEDYRQMYASRSDQGGGVILSQIHEIDYLYWLFGAPRRVFALGGKLSKLAIDVEDVASMMLECASEGQVIPIHIHADFIQKPASRGCKIIGDEGKIVVDLIGNSLYMYSRNGDLLRKTVFDDFVRNEMFLKEISEFLTCIENRSKSFISVEDGAISLKIALAAKESMVTGECITLN